MISNLNRYILDPLNNFNVEDACQTCFGTTYSKVAEKYPLLDKIAFVADHVIVRLLPMVALNEVLPFSNSKNALFMVGSSLFYRVTAEGPCPRRFALLSCFGALALDFAKNSDFSRKGSLPLVAYAVAVIYNAYRLTSSKPSTCCETPPDNEQPLVKPTVDSVIEGKNGEGTPKEKAVFITGDPIIEGKNGEGTPKEKAVFISGLGDGSDEVVTDDEKDFIETATNLVSHVNLDPNNVNLDPKSSDSD